MKKHLFGFLFFSRNGLHNIKKIFRKGKIEIGKDGTCMMTSVHHWLKAKKQINEVFSEPLVSEWGLDFRLCALEKMDLILQFYKFKNNDSLTLVKIHPHYTIDFRMLDHKRDMVFLCPPLKERKLYFEVEERYRTKKRSFPIWHWMSIPRKIFSIMTVMMLTLTYIFAHSLMCIETTETKTLCYKVKNYSDAILSNFSYKNYVNKI